MSDTFENARVGDKVYCLVNGEGVINKIDDTVKYPLEVRFKANILAYNVEGQSYFGPHMRTLYWSKPEIIAPPQPKRKVMKEFVFYVNVYRHGHTTTYTTRFEADKYKCNDRLGDAECIVITREVEE